MNTLIVYASLHGCTKKCAIHISKYLIGKIKIINIKDEKNVYLSEFTNIIIGTSIHTGYINPLIYNFCKKNLDLLVNKNIGVFLCFLDNENKFEYYLSKSFPHELLKYVKAKSYFGGEINYSKLTFFEKFYIEKTAKINNSVSKIKNQSIIKFCDQMNKFIGAN